ncbi:MAG: hypothetical protein AB7T48_01485 [Solirubrobacterales bacterium]
MSKTPEPRSPSPEEGSALIEVLVSALIIVIVGGAILTLLQATARSAGDSRNRTIAQAIAQEDQSRLRSMRISSLNRLNQNWTASVGGKSFAVNSTGVFVNNATGTPSCTGSNTSADYVRITSTVTWNAMNGRPPVVMQSIVAPSNGSLNPGNGTLTVSTINAAGGPLAGVGLAGTGPGTFNGTTDEGGCANFADLAAGNYTLTPTAVGLVDPNGKAPASTTVGVSASTTSTRVLQYDKPGALEVDFKYRVGSTATFAPSSASAIQVFNSGMSTPLTVTAPGGNPTATIATSAKLFPFTSPYAVYAGTCSSNNPNPESKAEAPGAPAVASILVPPGASTAPLPKGTIQLPALNVTVKRNGALLAGAKVRVTGSCSFARNYTTNAQGNLSDPGLPWGTYNVCISGRNTSNSMRMHTFSSVAVQDLTSGTTITADTNFSPMSSSSGAECW